jgi:hypothetical protein
MEPKVVEHLQNLKREPLSTTRGVVLPAINPFVMECTEQLILRRQKLLIL